MTNSNEKGERNWYFIIAVILLISFLVIAFLAAAGVYFYQIEIYLLAVVFWTSCGITTLYWIKAIISFAEYVRDH